MKSWLVYETHPLEKGKRKQRVYRYFVIAESADEAIAKVKEGEWAIPEVAKHFRADEFTYSAEPWYKDYISLSVYLD